MTVEIVPERNANKNTAKCSLSAHGGFASQLFEFALGLPEEMPANIF
jgi:hypothetical protein